MNAVLEQKLINDFPFLFQEAKLTPKESCLGRGFEVEDGWFGLVYLIAYELENNYNRLVMGLEDYYAWVDGLESVKKEIYEKYKDKDLIIAKQVKQKFGGLRFYYNVSAKDVYCNEFADDTLNTFEGLSWTTCEKCGRSNSTLRNKSWKYVSCNKCEEKQNKEEK